MIRRESIQMRVSINIFILSKTQAYPMHRAVRKCNIFSRQFQRNTYIYQINYTIVINSNNSSKKEQHLLRGMNKKIMKYYKILNLRQDCTDLDLRKAYRSMALKIHPDKLLDRQTHEQFHALNKIYNRLIAFRKNQKDKYLSFEQKTKPIPMGFDGINAAFVQFQQNFEKHIQTLDCILDSLRSMNRPSIYPPVNNLEVIS